MTDELSRSDRLKRVEQVIGELQIVSNNTYSHDVVFLSHRLELVTDALSDLLELARQNDPPPVSDDDHELHCSNCYTTIYGIADIGGIEVPLCEECLYKLQELLWPFCGSGAYRSRCSNCEAAINDTILLGGTKVTLCDNCAGELRETLASRALKPLPSCSNCGCGIAKSKVLYRFSVNLCQLCYSSLRLRIYEMWNAAIRLALEEAVQSLRWMADSADNNSEGASPS